MQPVQHLFQLLSLPCDSMGRVHTLKHLYAKTLRVRVTMAVVGEIHISTTINIVPTSKEVDLDNQSRQDAELEVQVEYEDVLEDMIL